MRILFVHNYYQNWGGEDGCAEQEIQLLRDRNHDVYVYSRSNNEIKDYGLFQKGMLYFETSWSRKSYRELDNIIETFRPDIIHCQNFFTLVSPALFYVAAKHKVPVVQGLHNFRLVCPSADFLRDGQVCQACVDHSLIKSIQYGCYHNSAFQTSSLALMLKAHRVFNTWSDKVTAYITLTQFSKEKLVEGGLPESKMFVRPNFMNTLPARKDTDREYALYVGRMSPEKGIRVLLEAWQHLPHIPLKIVGDGEERAWAEQFIREHQMNHVELVGFVSPEESLTYYQKAFFLVVPSLWYELFPRVILEAYATQTPVIASHLGSLAELIVPDQTGLLFQPGNARDLVEKVQMLYAAPDKQRKFGVEARQQVETLYSAENAYQQLMGIYEYCLSEAQSSISIK